VGAPTTTGSGASGTWGINITGNAATVTNGVYTTGDQTINGIKTFVGGHNTARTVLRYTHSTADGNAQLLQWCSEPGITYNGSGIGSNINVSGQYYGRDNNSVPYGLYLRFNVASGQSEFWSTTSSAGPIGGEGGLRAYIDSSGNLFGVSSVRGPIFYDTNNTAYYADPASTSNFVGLTVANTITGSISGNAATVTNGVYTTGTQTIGGAKTFSSNVTAPDFIATSDARIKFERQPITDALSKVCKMRGETFIKSGEVRRSAGYIAQDLEAVLPEGVYQSPEGVKQVSNSATIGLLIEAVKELQKEVAGLKAQLEKK
jgi:hypothetical protein